MEPDILLYGAERDDALVRGFLGVPILTEPRGEWEARETHAAWGDLVISPVRIIL